MIILSLKNSILTNCRVEPILASRESIRRAIIQFYHGVNY